MNKIIRLYKVPMTEKKIKKMKPVKKTHLSCLIVDGFDVTSILSYFKVPVSVFYTAK